MRSEEIEIWRMILKKECLMRKLRKNGIGIEEEMKIIMVDWREKSGVVEEIGDNLKMMVDLKKKIEIEMVKILKEIRDGMEVNKIEGIEIDRKRRIGIIIGRIDEKKEKEKRNNRSNEVGIGNIKKKEMMRIMVVMKEKEKNDDIEISLGINVNLKEELSY